MKSWIGLISAVFHVFNGSMRFSTSAVGDPGGKYGLFFFPDEVQPPLLYQTKNPYLDFFGSTLKNVSTVMGSRDALVWWMDLPPKGTVEYYSIVDYILFRFDQIPLDGYLPAVQMNDPLNQLVLKVLPNSNDSRAMIVCTASKKTWAFVQKTWCGGDDDNGDDSDFLYTNCADSINLLPITPDARLEKNGTSWIRSGSDLLSWHFRVNGVLPNLSPEATSALTRYFEKPQPFFLLRPRFHDHDDDDPDQDRLPALPRRMRLVQRRQNDSQQRRLEEKVRQWLFTSFPGITSIMNETVHHVVPDLQKCLNDRNYMPVFSPLASLNFSGVPGCDYFVRDALYSFTPSSATSESTLKALLWDDPQKVYAVMGLNQQELGECVFSNLLVTGSGSPEALHHTFNMSAYDLSGSATTLFGEEFMDWYVHVWSRNCGSISLSLCTTVTEEEISSKEYLFIAERKYLNLHTAIGPSPLHLLPPTLLIGL